MYENLFVFELANNHQGDVDHGLRIIDEMGKIKNKYNIKAAVKFQFRDYETFIHRDAMAQKDTNDKINRFLSTRLSWEDFEKMIERVKSYNMLTMCTPFDESSVDYINKMDIDIIKIGSPSLYDTPLLEKIRDHSIKPVIISSGGCEIEHIDKLVKMFKNKYLGLMHCVSIYPTPNEKMYLSNITKFIERYPNITIGFSTHEDPSNTDVIRIAYALGARMFEKHVGVDILNKYSASPEQVDKWIASYQDTKKLIGAGDRIVDENEKKDLQKLYRGVFFNKNIKAGDYVTYNDIYYAFPRDANGISSDEFKPFVAETEFSEHIPVCYSSNVTTQNMLDKYITDVKHFFPNLPKTFTVSHHYNPENIYKYGCVMYTDLNEELYSKKTIILLPKQQHPEHYHKIKTETFLVIEGTLELVVDGVPVVLSKNETFTIKPNVKHSFTTKTGVIFEEIATSITQVADSFYSDPKIQSKSDTQRKTLFTDY
jgi:sialic acid synthase SpsE/quercetin dioxygenase-like cupin family protein